MGGLEKRFPHYSRLLKLYPAAYQKKYKEPMLQTLADMLDDPEQSKTNVWARTVLDFPLSLIHQQLIYEGIAMKQMPDYMKRSSLIGALLMAPFFILIIINSLTNDRLYYSFFWSTPALFTWLIVLPALATLLNLAAFARWSSSQTASFWRSLADFRHNWPTLATTVIALSIIALAYGHDSVHCIIGNPITEAQKWDATINCIEQR